MRGSAVAVITVTGSVVVAACLAMTPPIRFGSGVKTTEEAQHADLGRLMPTAIDLDAKYPGEVRTVKAHVWADDDYRAQNIHWKDTFQRDLDDFNLAASALFGIRLEPTYYTWDRHRPDAALADGLGELAGIDRDGGAFVVIGLTSALSIVSENAEFLGFAEQPGRNIMLRGFAAPVERAAFEREFHDVDPEERDSTLEARRRHKATTVMLHELGHNLGAPHDTAVSDTIMNPTVSLHAAAFTPEARELIQAGIDRRLGREHRGSAAGSAPVAQTRHPSVVFEVTATGGLLFASQPVDLDTVKELLHQSAGNDPGTEVVVVLGQGAPQDLVVTVTEAAEAAGLHRVSIKPKASP
jgi:biopolymer transport protein ExbD